MFGILCILIGLSSAVGLHHTPECSLGESYWCSSLAVAKQCSAFSHCMTTVWATKKLSQDSSDICQFCENIMNDVKTFITNKETEDQILQYLDTACSLLPNADLQTECKTTVKNEIDQIITLIKNNFDPKVVCATIGLCRGFEDTVPHKPLTKLVVPQVSMDLCTDCEAFFASVKIILSSPTAEKELEDLLENEVCSQLGGLTDTCKQLVEAYIPQLVQALESDVSPAVVCKTIGLCKGDAKILVMDYIRKKNEKKLGVDLCGDCKTFFTDVKQLLASAAAQKEFEDFLDSEVCPQFGALQDQCKELINSYLPMLINLLENEMAPDTICKTLGFCSADGQTAVNKDMQNLAMLYRKIGMVQLPVKTAPVKASPQCILCEYIMSEIDKMLENNKTEAQIEAALMKVCNILPSTIRDECTSFVSQYGPAVIALLVNEVSPKLVCSTLGLCSGKVAIVKSEQTCVVCKLVMQYVDSLLSSKPTQKEIETVLEKVCNFLPTQYKTECDQIVEQYAPLLIQILAQEATPAEVCGLVGLCNSTLTHVGMGKDKPLNVRTFQPQDKPINVKPEEIIQPKNVQMLGVNPCTWGPSYWCKSKANAQECNAVTHCERHGWN